jgi:hypothetical protein
MKNQYVFLRGSGQADYSNEDITLWIAGVYVKTEGRLTACRILT